MTDYQPPLPDDQQSVEAAGQPQPDPLRSVYTSSFGDILKQTGVSLVVSTYQAGKVILVRYDPETGTVRSSRNSKLLVQSVAATGIESAFRK